MKRFWLVLLSLGLIMTFSVSAFAVDVKVSGEYYIAGMTLNKVMLSDLEENQSTAFLFQRIRIGTDFVVSPCLKLVTRFDAMERVWGNKETRFITGKTVTGETSESTQGRLPETYTYSTYSYSDSVDQENIEFDLGYIDYTSPIGLFQAGYMLDYSWGTIWGNRTTGPTAGQIKYFAPVGPVTLVAAYAKEIENNYSIKNAADFAPGYTDKDYDSYRVGAIYNFKGGNAAGEAGALFIFNRDASNKNAAFPAVPYMKKAYVLMPYFKAKIGPVALQGELNYEWGDAVKAENDILGKDIRYDALSIFLDGDATFGIVSVGGSFAYVSGDNDTSDGVNKAGLTGGRDWDPCLIMFNNTTMNSWVGPVGSVYAPTAIDGEMANAYFFQGRVAVTPVPAFTAGMSVSYATADKKPTGFAGGNYGWEVDVTGTYKITNNLTYMLGVGYLFTGDYFKGANIKGTNEINNDYLLINRLTLNF